jgi:hypothetical protein
MTQIRKFIPIPSEYIQAVAIEKANFPENDCSVQSWQWQDQQVQPTTIFSRWVGELNGKIMSHAYFIWLCFLKFNEKAMVPNFFSI